jgi:hypothetical protein
MTKVKEALKGRENGVKKKYSRQELIEQLQKEIKDIEIAYHQKTGALAYLKELE